MTAAAAAVVSADGERAGILRHQYTTQLPFVIGLTAGTDCGVPDERAIRAAFAAVLGEARAPLRFTPLLLLCGLRNAAEIACAEEAVAHRIALCALMPGPRDTVLQSMPANLRARVEALFAHGVEVRALAADAEQGQVILANTISRYSHLVVCVGACADVVRLRLEGLHVEQRLARLGIDTPAFPDVGPLVEIPMDGGASAVRHPPRYEGDVAARRDFESARRRLERFNKDLCAFGVVASNSTSLRDAVGALSNALQRRINAVTNVLYLLAAAATAVHLLRFPELWRTSVLGIALVGFAIARWQDYENRYQDYRALSEALRVRDAWSAGGITIAVEASYLRMHQSELQWIRMALRTVDLVAPLPVATPGRPRDGLCGDWFAGQWRYYRNARARELRRLLRVRRLALGAFAVGAACLLAAFITPNGTFLHGWGQALFALLTAWGALLTAYGDKRGFPTNSKRYDRMFFVFDTVKRRLEALPADDVREAQAIMGEVGREALVEHADWLLQRRDRPLSFVQG